MYEKRIPTLTGVFVLAALSAALLLNSCSDSETCPPDERLGTLSIDGPSHPFLPYNNLRFVEFVDSLAQDTAVLYDPISLFRDTARTIVENICEEEQSRSDRYYASEHLTVNYYDLDTSRKFRIIGNIGVNHDVNAAGTSALDPVLYDELKLTVHRTNPSVSGAVASAAFVSSDRGNASRLSAGLLQRIADFPVIAEVHINDSTYRDVYEFRTGEGPMFYFKPGRGVLAFRAIDGRWWNLHRTY
ncbi:MAG: hypothetical protein IT266_05580 [Saprospiraceae bacterium]|nr:hypothetical protein [Saprospiraceae bacterium]